MSVTFIDPPGPLANTSEPIDFTTTGVVTSVSIEYNPTLGTGSRETVFDGTADDNTGGDFSYLYSKSTRSADGFTWQVKRTGKWPATFRIRIKEAAAGVGVMATGRCNLSSGLNFDVVSTPAVDGCNAITYTVVSGTGLAGLAAPADTSKLHYLRLINDSAFAITLYHEHAGNAHDTSRFHISTGLDKTVQATQALDCVWIPASVSLTGTSRWFYFIGV